MAALLSMRQDKLGAKGLLAAVIGHNVSLVEVVVDRKRHCFQIC